MDDAQDYQDEGAALAGRVDRLRKEALNASAGWREEAKTNFDLYAGHQWDGDDIQILKDELRPFITFNRVAPIVDSIAGMEVSNRQEIAFLPREEGDVKKNEILTGAAQWVRDECDAEDEESDAFFDSLICGMGWIETRISYDDDPNGQIVMERIDPMQMYWDPSSKKRNLSDAGWIIRARLMPPDEIRERWDEKGEEAVSAAPSDKLPTSDDDWDQTQEPHDAQRAHEYRGKATGHWEATKGKHRVIEHQWAEYTRYYTVLNANTDQLEDLDAKEFKRMKPQFDAVGYEYVARRKKKYKRAFFCNGVELEKGDAPVPTDFSYHCITGKRDRNKNWWFGVVRSMKDPQQWGNKFLSEVLHIMNTNSKGGVMYETGAFEDAREAERLWANPRAFIRTTEGALAQGKVKEKPMATYPAGLDRMMEFAVSSIPMVTGMNMELMGLASKVQPGVLEESRKRAGLTILQTVFDSLRRYRKRQGRVLLHMITTYISDGRLIRVVGDAGAKFVPLVKEEGTSQYDVIVDESPTSPNQRDRTWAILQAIIPVALQSGIPIPPAILEYMPLPSSLVDKWKQELNQRQEKTPEQQAMEEATLRKLISEVMKNEAAAEKSTADAEHARAETDSVPIKRAIEVSKAGAEVDKIIAEVGKANTEAAGNVVAMNQPPADRGGAK